LTQPAVAYDLFNRANHPRTQEGCDPISKLVKVTFVMLRQRSLQTHNPGAGNKNQNLLNIFTADKKLIERFMFA
jgi:hypothetical protein